LRHLGVIGGKAELWDFLIFQFNKMKELGKAKITTKGFLAFPKGSIVNIAELEPGEETATGSDAEGGELLAYVADGDSSHDVDIDESDFVFIA